MSDTKTIALTPEDHVILAKASADLLDLSSGETEIEQMIGLLDLSTTLGLIRAGQTYPEHLPEFEKAVRSIASTAAIFERRAIRFELADKLRTLATRLAGHDGEPIVRLSLFGVVREVPVSIAHEIVDYIQAAIREAAEVAA